MIRQLMAAAEANRYKWLTVRALYLLSIIDYDLNKYSEAVELADHSLLLADQTGDKVGQLNALSSLIEYYRYFNRVFGVVARQVNAGSGELGQAGVG
jgi:hypothetical protein